MSYYKRWPLINFHTFKKNLRNRRCTSREIRFPHGPWGNLISFYQCNDDFTIFLNWLTHTGMKDKEIFIPENYGPFGNPIFLSATYKL